MSTSAGLFGPCVVGGRRGWPDPMSLRSARRFGHVTCGPHQPLQPLLGPACFTPATYSLVKKPFTTFGDPPVKTAAVAGAFVVANPKKGTPAAFAMTFKPSAQLTVFGTSTCIHLPGEAGSGWPPGFPWPPACARGRMRHSAAESVESEGTKRLALALCKARAWAAPRFGMLWEVICRSRRRLRARAQVCELAISCVPTPAPPLRTHALPLEAAAGCSTIEDLCGGGGRCSFTITSTKFKPATGGTRCCTINGSLLLSEPMRKRARSLARGGRS